MNVVATAGHVDHGKSTLVRALTGMEPDRWAEEHRRGLTIDLGFAWTSLPSGREVAFVDVPGHQRFMGNMLAGLGPAPVVCFVVAADESWQPQSSDHRDAIAALAIQHGLVVITRADRATPEQIEETQSQARAELACTGLCDAPMVVTSALRGAGLSTVTATLDDVLGLMPPPNKEGRVRLWLDRSFTIRGAGTVVTGTLSAGTLTQGAGLELHGRHETSLRVTVRGLQSRGAAYPLLQPVNRVALNLRGVTPGEVGRGDVLVTPGTWPITSVLDVRRTTGPAFLQTPSTLTVHVGTAAVPARVRPFTADHARVYLDAALPLVAGDRFVLRDPGGGLAMIGALILDVDPPSLRRRGDGTRRAAVLARTTKPDAVGEVARRGAVRVRQLQRLGFETTAAPASVRVVGDWWIHPATYDAWRHTLRKAVEQQAEHEPLPRGLSYGAARDLLHLPDEQLLDALAQDAGMEQHYGRILTPHSLDTLGAAETAVTEVERQLRAQPFRAPEAGALAALHLGLRELAAAERAGRLLRLASTVVLLPNAPTLAIHVLAELDQPFTTSQARQALDSTRRVVVPLLEYLDQHGRTQRIDPIHRVVTK